MEKRNKTDIIRRIISISIITQIIIFLLSYFFTKNIIYSIITLIAASVAISGFIIMVKITDRYLRKRRGRGLLFLASFLKITLIMAIFYPVSKISEQAVLFFILGLSVLVISTLIEGLYQLFLIFSHDRT